MQFIQARLPPNMAKFSKVRLLKVITFLAFGIDTSANSSQSLSPWFLLTTLIPAFHIVKWPLAKLYPLKFQLLADLDQKGPGPGPGDGPSPSEMHGGGPEFNKAAPPTQLVMAIQDAIILIAAAVNLSIRMAIICSRKKLLRTFDEFKTLNSIAICTCWSHNELSLVTIIAISFTLRYIGVLADFIEKIGHPRVSKGWNLVMSFIYINLREIYGAKFQIEVISLVYLCMLVSIARNLGDFSAESRLRSLGINKSLLPRHLLRREGLHLLTSKYICWMKFWRNANDALGFILALFFLQLFFALSFSSFIFITASIDMSIFNPYAIRKLVQSTLLLGKILCLGNAAHELKLAVSIAYLYEFFENKFS